MSKSMKGKLLLIEDRSLKSERRYRLVVRLKAIEYKEDYLCYLSSTSSLHPVVLPKSFIIFLLVLMVRMCMVVALCLSDCGDQILKPATIVHARERASM